MKYAEIFYLARLVCTWFLEIVPVQMSVCLCVYVRVRVPLRLLITSGVMWCVMDLIRLVKQVL